MSACCRPAEEWAAEEDPLVSVVMAVRDEERSIHRSLGSVLAQDYLVDRLQVIVADGMSIDGTRLAIDRLIGGTPGAPPVTVIDNPGRIVPTGLNAAISRASGDVIVRVDGHSELPPDYVRRCVLVLESTRADNVGGIAAAEGHTPAAEAIAAALSSPFGVGGARFRTGGRPGWVDTVPFGTWRRDVFDRIGGFDEELVRNQDDEFNFRLIQAGGRIWFDPTIRVAYECRSSFRALGRQYFQYGLYKVRVIQKRRGVASVRQLAPPMLVAALLASLSLALATRRARWLTPVLFPYAVGLAVATQQAAPPDRAAAVRLPLAFVTLHMGYGTGFLAGLWRWRRGFMAAAWRSG